MQTTFRANQSDVHFQRSVGINKQNVFDFEDQISICSQHRRMNNAVLRVYLRIALTWRQRVLFSFIPRPGCPETDARRLMDIYPSKCRLHGVIHQPETCDQRQIAGGASLQRRVEMTSLQHVG